MIVLCNTRYSSCPSLQGRDDAADLFRALVKPLRPPLGDAIGRIMHEMLQNELRYSEDYVVFYHSFSSSCLLYEVQTALAACILNYPIDGPPVMRLRRQPYNNIRCLHNLLHIWESSLNDQTAEFQVQIHGIVETLGQTQVSWTFQFMLVSRHKPRATEASKVS